MDVNRARLKYSSFLAVCGPCGRVFSVTRMRVQGQPEAWSIQGGRLMGVVSAADESEAARIARNHVLAVVKSGGFREGGCGAEWIKK